MAATGQSINMLSLFALIMILGIIVDDAIVVGESIYHKRQQGLPPRRAAVEGAVEVAMPVAAAVTTTVVAFVPLLFVSGIMGKFIRVLPIAVICALLVSLVESLFMMPAHLRDLTARPLSEEPGNGAVRLLRRLRLKFGHALEWIGNEIYEPIIRRVLNWRYATVAAAFAVLLASWGAYQGGLIKYEMFPEIDTDLVFAQIEFPSGTPVEQTEVALERMRLALDRVAARYEERTGRPLVLGLYSVAGAALGYNQTEVEMGAQLGLRLIELLPAEERLWHFRSFLIEWEEELGILPGVISMDFEGPQMGPGGNTIEIALLGHNLDDLRAATRQLRDRLSTYEGLYQIEDDFREGRLEVWPRLKPEARNLGLTAADLGMQVRQAFYGDEAMRIQRGRDDLKVWIRLPREQRTSLDDVRNLRIRTRDGREIPISAVADLELRQGFFSITRKNGLRRIVVTARVNKSIVNSNDVVADLNARFFRRCSSSSRRLPSRPKASSRKTRNRCAA